MIAGALLGARECAGLCSWHFSSQSSDRRRWWKIFANQHRFAFVHGSIFNRVVYLLVSSEAQ